MKAAFIEKQGPALEVLRYGDLPTPTPGPGQALVRIGAASVNPIDTYIRNGAQYWPLPYPYIVGADFAGRVEAIGPGVSKVKVGDRVWGTNQGFNGRQGTFAEFAAVDQQWMWRTPDNVRDEDAAAMALVGVTAHLGLRQTARLQAGETIFVNGGTGGVGSVVVQMAKAIGARVLATGGSEAKREALVALGADSAVNYAVDDVGAKVQEFAPGGVNVYWETVREPDFDKIVSYLAERGRIVLMAGRDARPVFPVGPFYVKQCVLAGFVMFKATADEMAVCADEINRWMSEGKLKANVSRVFPLSEAAQAHHLQEENTLRRAGTLAGKIVVKP